MPGMKVRGGAAVPGMKVGAAVPGMKVGGGAAVPGMKVEGWGLQCLV